MPAIVAPPSEAQSAPGFSSAWLVLALVVLAFVARQQCQRAHPSPLTRIKMATFNVRYDPSPDERRENPFWGSEHCWNERRHHVADQILWESPDVIGLQEVLDHQLRDLRSLLGVEYDGVGVGRDDGKRAGEAVPVFWKRGRFEQVGQPRYFWLSETPEVPGSISWDAGQTRMATLVTLRARAPCLEAGRERAGFKMHALCTHFDDRGPLSRGKAASVVLEQLSDLIKGDDLVLLMGDLNSESRESGYIVLTDQCEYALLQTRLHSQELCSRYEVDAKPTHGPAFLDAHREVQFSRNVGGPPLLHTVFGENGTFTDFKPPWSEPLSTIDFCMLANNAAARSWHVRQAAILPNLFRGKPRLSDHRMASAVLHLDT